jgi:DNA-binding MarR family transcriptional regulator
LATLLQETRIEAGGEAEFALGDFVPYLLTRITNRLSKSLVEALKEVGLTPPFWRVLAVLNDGGRRTLTELSVYTAIDQSTLSRVIDRMQAQLLVSRRVSPEDARVQEIQIAPHGREKFVEILPVAMDQYEWAVRNLSERELVELRQILRKILESIRTSPHP